MWFDLDETQKEKDAYVDRYSLFQAEGETQKYLFKCEVFVS